jgi:cytoplasmic iron level regulating protein YaaA (DUF328/UPF0246 family)
MIVLMNSSKTLDTERPAATRRYTIPEFIEYAKKLVSVLRTFAPDALADLMGISAKLARLNADRYQQWKTPFNLKNAKQSLAAFRGDVFAGLAVDGYAARDFAFAQSHVRILSGLYGPLRPLDLIQPYRLEMATRLATFNGSNLYELWGKPITAALGQLLQKEKSGILINLASTEYVKVINSVDLKVHMVTPVFQEIKNGKSRTVVIYTKKARGLMCDEIIRKRIVDVEDLKRFNRDGYRLNNIRSSDKRLVFERNG